MGTNNGDSSREEGDTVTYEDLITFEYECEETEVEIGEQHTFLSSAQPTLTNGHY